MSIQLAQQTSVLLITDTPNTESFMTKALQKSNYCIEHIGDTDTHLLKLVEQYNPDLVIILTHAKSLNMLDKLCVISQIRPTPIVIFTQQGTSHLVSDYIKAGVSAYISGSVESNRVVSILDTACIRFSEHQKLKTELVKTQEQLNNQKTIERAKIWLMENKHITEKKAYQSIRKLAMDNGQKMAEVAKHILSLAH